MGTFCYTSGLIVIETGEDALVFSSVAYGLMLGLRGRTEDVFLQPLVSSVARLWAVNVLRQYHEGKSRMVSGLVV